MEYQFIGWCREGESDKVWAAIRIGGEHWDGTYATVWGRRGKKLSFKIIKDSSDWEIEKLARKKQVKGYVEFQKEQLFAIYPEFEQDLEKIGLIAILKA
jgi:predicted DNA-binding WGR domain protein